VTTDRGPRSIAAVASDLGLAPDELIRAGAGVLRVPVPLVRTMADRPRRARVVLVSAMTPTARGEGKTVVAIGLAMALERRGFRSAACLRQPSLGPVFGSKGGASGGGRAIVEPRPAIDLGLTGDLDAITNAQNLLVSLVDNHLYHHQRPEISPASVALPRASAMEDRSLRTIATGVLSDAPGSGSFVISAACESAAIHALASDFVDLKARVARMLVGRDPSGAPVRAGEIGAAGACAALLAGALPPNLVQTAEGTAAFVHGIPYANVAHGTCSRLAIEAARALADFAVVEAGFSTELGAEKYADLVAPAADLEADVGVIVATLRALRYHGGAESEGPPSPEGVTRGLANLAQHVENLRRLGLDPIVALNRFPSDTSEEVRRVEGFCAERGVACVNVTPFEDGGRGAELLAERVVEAAGRGQKTRPVYARSASAESALELVATQLYGATGVDLSPAASDDLARIRALGEPTGPVCIAKTSRSLSDDPHLRGRPSGFRVRVERFERWSGAGFTVALLRGVIPLPGLPEHPASWSIDLTPDGRVVGVG
jgi:formate--tetrahydrofolate ligase